MDIYLISEGTHRRLWQVLGAHPRAARRRGRGGVRRVGTQCAGGERVGDFSRWDDRRLPMRRLGVVRRLRALRAGSVGRRALQVPRSSARRVRFASRPIPSRRRWSFRRAPRRGSRRPPTSGETPSGWPAAPASDLRAVADGHLRGPPRLLGSRARGRQPAADLPRDRAPPDRPREAARLHATSSSCRSPSTRSPGRGAIR